MLIKMWHTFHMVTTSPWPLMVSLHLFSAMANMRFFLNSKIPLKILWLKILLTALALMWWKDTLRENMLAGNHASKVIQGLKLGIAMFILSEIFFFLSFFWAYFHFFLGPRVEVGQQWPPLFIDPLTPVGTPLLNTIILLSSGVSITCAHNFLISNKYANTLAYLTVTWLLGIYFVTLQYMEYSSRPFSMSDSSFGRIFFIGTGFHGIHVIVGTVYLFVSTLILSKKWANKYNLIRIDLSAWYWHFVDVVWIYLYLFVYWLPYV